jgi:hypothetical protein
MPGFLTNDPRRSPAKSAPSRRAKSAAWAERRGGSADERNAEPSGTLQPMNGRRIYRSVTTRGGMQERGNP